MLQPKDLRVGNFIYKNLIKENAVFEISKGYEIDHTGDRILGYKPIPITPEWLKDFNFIQDNYGMFYKTNDNTNTSKIKIEFWAKKCKIKGRWVWDICIDNDTDKKDFSGANFTHLCFISYVHQLQNIYLSIKGYELERSDSNGI